MTIRIDRLDDGDLERFAHLTFPTTIADAQRHRGSTIAFVARVDGIACGLAIAVKGPPGEFELLSLFVSDLFRRRSVGTQLLDAIERHFRDCDARLGISYLSVDPSDQGPVRFLLRRGWTRPEVASLICRTTVARMFGPGAPSTPDPPEGCRIISWAAVNEADRKAIAQGVGSWVAPDLNPLPLEAEYHPGTSIALLSERGGERRVVGWVITHRIAVDTLRWTCSYVDPALQSAMRIMSLWWEVGRRQAESSELQNLIFTVPLQHPRMVRFANRHMKPRLEHMQYACVTRRTLRLNSEPHDPDARVSA